MVRSSVVFIVSVAFVVGACATAGNGQGSDGGSGADSGPTPDAAPQNDAAPACATSPCDILEQCGCQPTEACDFGGMPTETECRASDATGTELSTCANNEACAAGYGCFNTGGASHCRKFCDSADMTDPCGAAAHCILNINDGSGGTLDDLQLCTKACSPEKATNNGCPDSTALGCVALVFNAGMANELATTDCRPANAAGINEVDCSASGTDGVCAAGFTCVVFSGGSNPRDVCKQTCVVPGGACAIGVCSGFTTNPLIVDGTEYGICN